MMASFGSLSIVPWILFAQASWSLDAVPATTVGPTREAEGFVEIRDRGEIFDRAGRQRALEALQGVPRGYRGSVLIQTVQSLDGARIADAARRQARTIGADRLYILIAADERDVGVVGAWYGPVSRLTSQQCEAIRRSFLGPLQAGDPDAALEQGMGAISTTLAAAAVDPRRELQSALVAATILLVLLVLSWLWERRWALREQGRRSVKAARENAHRSSTIITTILRSWRTIVPTRVNLSRNP